MGKQKKQTYTFKREIKPKKKPEHLILGRMSANVQIVCDYDEDPSPMQAKILEKRAAKQGKTVLDRSEKMVCDKLDAFDGLITRQRALAEKGVPKAEEPVAKELKAVNGLLSEVESDLGGELRLSIEKLIKKELKIGVEATSVGMNVFRAVRLKPGLFEGLDDGLSDREVKNWLGLTKGWAKDAQALSLDSSGAGTFTEESELRSEIVSFVTTASDPTGDAKVDAAAAKDASAVIKKYITASNRYGGKLGKSIKGIDGNISFVKKQKNEVAPGHSKSVLLHFADIRKNANRVSINIEAGGKIAVEMEKLLPKAGEERAKIKKLLAAHDSGVVESIKLLQSIEKSQQKLNKLLRQAAMAK